MEPPKDLKQEGVIYEMYNGSRACCRSIDEDKKRMEGVIILGEEALYSFYEKEGKQGLF